MEALHERRLVDVRPEDEKYLLEATVAWLRRLHDWSCEYNGAVSDGGLMHTSPEPPEGVDLVYRTESTRCSIDYNGEVYKRIPDRCVGSYLAVAEYLEGFVCRQCGVEVEKGRQYPVYQIPTCHKCLPPPPPLKYV